jgi:8-oxo-dGTP diphosphatase
MNTNGTEFIARAFILHDGEVLLCRAKEKGHYFFPGGHVEFGEFIEDALKREVEEEIGEKLDLGSFIGLAENIFEEGSVRHHEVNVVFEARLEKKEAVSREDWLEFHWVKLEDIPEMKVMPLSLRDALIQWTRDCKTFLTKQNECLSATK